MFTPVILPPHSSPTRPPSDLVTVMPVSDPPLIVPVLPTLPIVPPEIVPEPLLPPVPGSSTDGKVTRLDSRHTVVTYAAPCLTIVPPMVPVTVMPVSEPPLIVP